MSASASGWLWLPHVHWGAMIALYLFLGGTAGGAYIVSAWASFIKSVMDADNWLGGILLGDTSDEAHWYACGETARWGSVLSVLSIAVGGTALITHLGAPLRALTFPVLFTNFGSWLTIGTWLIVLFTIIAAFETLWLHFGGEVASTSGLSLFPRRILGWIDGFLPVSKRGIVWLLDRMSDITRPAPRIHGGIRLLGGVASLGLIGYTAMLLSDVTVVPFWTEPYLPLIFLTSGVSTGISAALLGTVFSGGALSRVNHRFCLTDDAIIVVELGAIGLLLSYLSSASNVAAQSTESALFGAYSLEFVGGVLILGTALPVVLSITVTLLHQFTDMGESQWGRRLLTGGYATKYVLVLAGGFLLRYVVLLAAIKTPLGVPGL